MWLPNRSPNRRSFRGVAVAAVDDRDFLQRDREIGRAQRSKLCWFEQAKPKTLRMTLGYVRITPPQISGSPDLFVKIRVLRLHVGKAQSRVVAGRTERRDDWLG